MAATTGTPPSSLQGSGAGRRADPIFRWVVVASATSVLVVLAAMILRTAIDAWPVFDAMGIWGFISGQEWSVGSSRSEVTGTYGAFPFIYGTLKISFVALLFAVPLAIGIALFINEVAPARLKKAMASVVELLAMVPSVVYALVGIYFFRLEIWAPIGQFIADSPLGSFRFFGPPVLLSSYWSAANILAIMILPIITAICREAFAQVPRDEVNAAYAMGATRWETMRHVIVPRSFPGIVGGTMLGLGRALGETIAIAYLIGSSQRWAPQLFFGGDAMTSVIVNTFADAAPEAIWALLAIGVTLFFITMIVNVLARLIVYRVGRFAGDAAL
ncbi:MAG: phosphate ABC transporter permease subunit PstC [Nitriliruptoraceae bacterium]